MEATPLARQIIATCLINHDWEQGDLAEKSGIARATISHHVNGLRPIRDDHLAAYAGVLDRSERAALTAAWIRDTMSPEIADSILEPTTNLIGEEARAWRPNLDPELSSMLDWWAKELAADPELAELFRSITLRSGYDGSKTNVVSFETKPAASAGARRSATRP